MLDFGGLNWWAIIVARHQRRAPITVRARLAFGPCGTTACTASLPGAAFIADSDSRSSCFLASASRQRPGSLLA